MIFLISHSLFFSSSFWYISIDYCLPSVDKTTGRKRVRQYSASFTRHQQPMDRLVLNEQHLLSLSFLNAGHATQHVDVNVNGCRHRDDRMVWRLATAAPAIWPSSWHLMALDLLDGLAGLDDIRGRDNKKARDRIHLNQDRKYRE